jgi:hypothetical protein
MPEEPQLLTSHRVSRQERLSVLLGYADANPHHLESNRFTASAKSEE